MCSTNKFFFVFGLIGMQFLVAVRSEDSVEETELDHSILCPPRSHDIFHKPCMDHCAKSYRNIEGGACGQCVDYAERSNFIQKKCFCFLGLRCFPAVQFKTV